MEVLPGNFLKMESISKPCCRPTSCVSRLFVTGFPSLDAMMMWRKLEFGISFTKCHFTENCPFHLSACQYSTLRVKSTLLVISATPQNCPLALTEKKRKTGQAVPFPFSAADFAALNAASNPLFPFGVLAHTLYFMLLWTSSSL